MKKIYLVLLAGFLIQNVINAQSEILGLNSQGANGFGTIYGMPTGSTGIATQFDLTGNPGSSPQYTKLLQTTPNGKLYGMTNTGGVNNAGVIFEYDTATNVYLRKYEFGGSNGANPRGALIQAQNGKLYGMTQSGGTSSLGVIFEYDITTNTYTKKVDFTGNTGVSPGSQPFGTLVDPNPGSGKLYGMTRFGGANGLGVLFEYDYLANTYTVKVDFNGNVGSALGANPFGQLIKAGTNLYGLASAGGTNNVGTLFEYDYTNNIFTKKINLATASGSGPQGSLLLASNGLLYGMTVSGGAGTPAAAGVIFSYSIATNAYTKLVDLGSGVGQGANPTGELIQATNGKLYAMTRLGGATNVGVIFEYDIAGPTYSKKIDLVNSTAIGSAPFGSLIQVSTGKIYGMTSNGGNSGGGVIFNYVISSNTYTKKIDLNTSNGGNPNGHLIQASNGLLYGLAAVGGTNNVGVLFEYNKTTNTYTKKIDMLSTNGITPFGSMLQASNSKLYGLTSAGGTSGLGTLFEYDISLNTYTKRVDFTGNTGTNPGSVPYGSLVQFSGNGKLYGMTKQGGTSAQGVIFEFDPTTNLYTKKIDLTAVSGFSAFGSMVESGSKLYGMTQLGGANSLGAIFEYDPVTNIYTKKIDFTGNTGAAPGSQPFGSMVTTSTVGVLYGMTRLGGANGQGVIFEYNVSSNTYTSKFDLSTANGSQPFGSLIRAANGNLYGVTTAGGTNSVGVLFEYNIASAGYTKKLDFTNATGNSPTYTQLLEVCTKPLTPGSITSSTNSLCQGNSATNNFSISAVANATSYAWTMPLGSSTVSGATSNIFASNLGGVAAGTYTYGVAGVNICGTGTLSSNTITVHALPTLSVNSGSFCSGLNFTISPSGASTYTVQGGSFIVSPSSNTSYTVAGTSAPGCLSSNTVVSSVTVNALPTIGVNSGPICFGNSFTMVPTGVLTSTVSGGSLIVSPATNTTYALTGTDANGCVSSNTAISSVTVNSLPIIGVNNGTICAGVNHTFAPSGAATYTIQGGSLIVSPPSTTSYTVAGTSTAGCISASSATGNVLVNVLPVIGINNGTICSGKSHTFVPSGASTYTIQGGAFVVSPISNSNYTVSGTSTAGCVSASTATGSVAVNALPTIGVNSGPICFGNSFTMVPTGVLTSTVSGGSLIVSPATNTTYALTGTDANGCVSSNTAISSVTVNSLPIIGVNNGTICAGVNHTFAPSGAATYTIQGGSLIVSPPSTTSYTVAGTSTAGCISASSATGNVLVNVLPVIGINNGTICSGKSHTFVPSGASTYTIQGGAFVVSPISNSNYTVSGTSTAGCVSASTATGSVTVNALPIIGVNSGQICFGASFTMVPTGVITSTVTGGSLIVSPTTNTTYSLTGTGSNGCVSSNTAISTVTVNSLPIITVNSGSICNSFNHTFTPSGASTYSIQGGSFVVSPSASTSYTVAGTSTAGCISVFPATGNVTVFALPVIGINSGTICSGTNYTFTPTGASTYTIQGGSFVVSPPSNSTYTVAGTSTAGCVSALPATANVTVYALPVISVNSGTICLGNTYTFVPNGASTYTISGGSLVVSPSVTTNYSVAGTSSLGCLSASSAVGTVTVYALPSVSVNSGTICLGRTFTIVASGAGAGANYTVSPGGSTLVSPTVNSTYSVMATNTLGCMSASPAVSSVSVIALPVISSTNGAVCLGSIFTTSVSGASTYTYISVTNTINSSGSIPLNLTSTTTFSVIGRSAVGCQAANPSIMTVTVNPLPPVSVSGPTAICEGETATLTASGANTYNWGTSSNTFIVVSPLASTTYSVLGTDLNNCSQLTPYFLSVNPLPTITVINGAICPGNSYTLTPSGAITYTYSGGSNVVNPAVTTNYSVSGTSSLGCVALQPAVATVSVVNILTVTVSGNTNICIGGSASLTASGASTYSWSTGSVSNTEVLSPVSSSVYTVVGASGVCNDTAIVQVVVNPLPTITVTATSSVICLNESVSLTSSGAITYTWSTQQIGSSIVVSPTVSSNYTVNATDANGCSNSSTYSLQVDECVGISKPRAAQNLFKLYPNPNEGQFFVESGSEIEILVVNALGQQVLVQKVSVGKNQLELHEVAKGMYFLKYKEGSSEKTIKIIKQ